MRMYSSSDLLFAVAVFVKHFRGGREETYVTSATTLETVSYLVAEKCEICMSNGNNIGWDTLTFW